jgi:hypothetical protein
MGLEQYNVPVSQSLQPESSEQIISSHFFSLPSQFNNQTLFILPQKGHTKEKKRSSLCILFLKGRQAFYHLSHILSPFCFGRF